MSESRDIPMVFTTESVRAIFADLKWKTRRLIRGLGNRGVFCGYSCYPSHSLAVFGDSIPDDPCPYEIRVPWRRGDRLWVREMAAMSTVTVYGRSWEKWFYRADYHNDIDVRWRSPRFMPKRACRLWLRVESVDVQRVQDITEEDARAEGFKDRAGFCAAWDKMHKPPNDVEGKPWVWVVSFSRLEDRDA